MSNEVALFEGGQVPAHLRNRSAGNEDMMGGSFTAFPRLSAMNGRFRVEMGGEKKVLPELSVPVVFVRANKNLTKAYFAKSYAEAGEEGKPDCFSNDGVRPDPASTTPQAATCAACPHNAWGSAPLKNNKQSKAKACPERKKVAILHAADLKTGPFVGASIPAASLGNFFAYVKKVNSKGISLADIVTLIGLEEEKEFPMWTFTFSRFVTPEEVSVIEARSQEDIVEAIIGINPQATNAPSAPPAPAPAQAPVLPPTPPPAPSPSTGFGFASVIEEKAAPPPAAKEPSSDSLKAGLEALKMI